MHAVLTYIYIENTRYWPSPKSYDTIQTAKICMKHLLLRVCIILSTRNHLCTELGPSNRHRITFGCLMYSHPIILWKHSLLLEIRLLRISHGQWISRYSLQLHLQSYLIFKLSDLQECILYGWVVVVDIRGIEIL